MSFSTRGHHYLPAIFGEEIRDYRERLDAGNGAEAKFTVTGSYPADDVSAYYRSPVELNWTRNINFDHDFIGREAIERDVADPQRKTVTLVWESDDVVEVFASFFETGQHHKWLEMPYQPSRAIEGDAVRVDGEFVGMSTGRGYSYYFGEMISMYHRSRRHGARDRGHRDLGEGSSQRNPRIADHAPKEISATLAPAPYKDDKRRTDLTSLASD